MAQVVPSTSKARLSRLCLTRWSHVMLPWGSLRWHYVAFRRRRCHSCLICWTSLQLVDCDTFVFACYLLTPGQCDCVCEAWQVYRGQLQLHRKQCSTSGCTFGIILVSVTGTKDVSVNNNEALTADIVQPRSRLLSKPTAFFFHLFSGGVMQFWGSTNFDFDVLSVVVALTSTRVAGSFSLAVTLFFTKEVHVSPVSLSITLCPLVFGVLSWSRTLFLVQQRCTVSVRSRLSNRCLWTNRGAMTFLRSALSRLSCSVCPCSRFVLDALVQQRCSSRVCSLEGAYDTSNAVKISPELRCTRALKARSSGFLAPVSSQGRIDRRNYWRDIRRSRPCAFLSLGVSSRNLQCASFRPDFLTPCACRASHHSFWSACFSSDSLGKWKTTGSWHRETLRHARVDSSQRCILRGRFHGVTRHTLSIVSSVLSSPAYVVGVHADGRMLFRPDLYLLPEHLVAGDHQALTHVAASRGTFCEQN